MAITVKSVSDLNRILDKYIIQAMELTKTEIFNVISSKVSEYYSEPVFNNDPPTQPRYYQNTGMLMSSLTATNVIKEANGFSCKIGWDDDYLNFRYSGGFVSATFGDGYNAITGKQVLDAMNSGTHGYTVPGSHNYWDEALAELGGMNGIKKLFVSNLKKCGITTK